MLQQNNKELYKKLGARTRPCFTILLIINESDLLPSFLTLDLLLSWKDLYNAKNDFNLKKNY